MASYEQVNNLAKNHTGWDRYLVGYLGSYRRFSAWVIVEHCLKAVFTNILHNIFVWSIFVVPGRERATLGSDPGNTGTLCMGRLSVIDSLLFV